MVTISFIVRRRQRLNHANWLEIIDELLPIFLTFFVNKIFLFFWMYGKSWLDYRSR